MKISLILSGFFGALLFLDQRERGESFLFFFGWGGVYLLIFTLAEKKTHWLASVLCLIYRKMKSASLTVGFLSTRGTET